MAEPVAPIVSAVDLRLSFGERLLWEGLSFELQPGELLAVLGPNGTGKTSLIRIMLGLLQPSAGRIEIEGGAPAERRKRIGYVPQQGVFDRDLPVRGRDLGRLGFRKSLAPVRPLLPASGPILSLDPPYQRVIVGLLDERRRQAGTPVVF